jgi:chemotaxis protein MotA
VPSAQSQPPSQSAAAAQPGAARKAEPAGDASGRPAALPRLAPLKRAMDPATVFGLAGALLMVIIALAVGGSLRAFLNLPSALIVIGGTIAVTAVSQSWQEVRLAAQLARAACVRSMLTPRDAAQRILTLADAARRHGPLVLQGLLPSARQEPVLRRAIELVVDGLPEDEVERTLRAEMQAQVNRTRQGAAVLRRAAEVAPAMGLIGTLVGLVQMLGNLQDPSAIGPAMAVALLTTFYGALLGTLVLTPLAGKIEHGADLQSRIDVLYAMGALSMARQENPRRLELAINSVLPPDARLNFFD